MDKRLLSAIVFFAVFLTDAVSGSEWTAVPPPMVYSCQGSSLQLLWTLQTDPETETVDTIKWFFNSDLLATFLHGQFFPGMKHSDRVDQQQDTGVVISDVTPSDSGNYSIQVMLRKGDASITVSHSVTAQVGDGLMLENSRLEVTQDPVASWNTTSSTWNIRLLCGRFTFKGENPISVEWELSTGETPESSGYEGGNFYLTLPRAHLFESVSYTCRIPERFYPNMCMNNDTKPGITAAIFLLDEVKVRLTLAEARLTLAEAELVRVDDKNSNLKNEKDHLQMQLTEANKEITKTLSNVRNDITQLQNLNLISLGCSTRDYKVWDDWRKDVSYTGYESLCDNNVQTNWYRLYLNGNSAVLATSCQPTWRCGTKASTWLDLQGQGYPSIGYEVVGRACSNWDNNCCMNTVPVTVRNCGTFFVYKLQALPYCTYAYCFQPK